MLLGTRTARTAVYVSSSLMGESYNFSPGANPKIWDHFLRQRLGDL